MIAAVPAGLLIDTNCIAPDTLLFVSMLLWSTSVVLTGYSDSYLATCTCRVVLAIFTSTAGTLCLSIISEYFPSEIRSSACALWNFAIYIGFSAAYGAGNAVSEYFDNWRYTWWCFGYLGIGWSFLIGIIPIISRRNMYQIVDSSSLHHGATTSGIHREWSSALSQSGSDIDVSSQIDLTDEFTESTRKIKGHRPRLKMFGSIRSLSQAERLRLGIADGMAVTPSHDQDEGRGRDNTGGTATTLDVSNLGHSEIRLFHQHQMALFHQLQYQHMTVCGVLLYLVKTPSLLLLLFASFYRNCGGYVWYAHYVMMMR